MMQLKHFLISILVCTALVGAAENADTKPPVRVLCTTFPVYQVTRNVVRECPGLSVELMLPSALGCPHDYTLTPQDMQKLAAADVLLINGLGMEEFLGAPVERANADLHIIDSSRGISDVIYTGHACGAHCGHAHHDHGDAHEANPHVFVSPRLRARMAGTIAAGLARLNPSASLLLTSNAHDYAASMSSLADEMAAGAAKLANKRIVEPHGIFDYLARDIGLEIVAVIQPHGQEPSAAEMIELVRTIRARKAGVILTEPQYGDKTGTTLARETGIPHIMLDPCATGPSDAPLDHFQTVMRANMTALNAALAPQE